MLQRWKRRQQIKRVKPGNGEPLPPFRWWQILHRSLFTLEMSDPEAGTFSYAIDVRQWGDRSDGEVRARLYRDGALQLISRLPARFPVPGAEIDVAVGNFGMKRCHLVAADTERQLTPHPYSAEGRRATFERRHRIASKVISVLAIIAVLMGLCVAIPAIIGSISQAPPIAESIGTFESPVDLPPWASITVGIVAVLGSIERALRFRTSWIDGLAS